MTPRALRPIVMPRQVDQLPADLHRGQVDEAAHRGGLDVRGALQSRRAAFWRTSSVCSQRFTPDSAEHLPGQPDQSLTGDLQQLVPPDPSPACRRSSLSLIWVEESITSAIGRFRTLSDRCQPRSARRTHCQKVHATTSILWGERKCISWGVVVVADRVGFR